MEWGIELWDQFELVDKHHQHGIDFCEKYAKFVKERCSIELEYASKLRKLVKSHQPKKRDEERSIFSTHKAFQCQLSELNDIAGQHETVAEEMHSNISKVCQNFCNDLKLEKKKLFQDGRHQQLVLEQHERVLEQTKKKFEKEWRDCEKAQVYFEKLDSDGNVTKADVEKARHSWMTKKDMVESSKTDYGATLQQFNTDQEEHYTVHMPKVFLSYKEADERRILKSRDLMVEYAKVDKKVKPIIQKCLDGMEQAANAIDAKLDSQLVVDKLKSGFTPPSAKEFEDYTAPQHNRLNTEEGVESSPRNSVNLGRQANRKGGLSWLFGNKKLQPKEMKKRLSVPKSDRKSTSDSHIEKAGKDETVTVENGGENTEEDDITQKARTLSFTPKTNNVNKLTPEKRSSSMDLLNQSNGDTKAVVHRKSSKSKSKHQDFRVSMPNVNKKKLMSIFRQPKEDIQPTVEVSGPISCEMLGSAANDDYLVPISSLQPAAKNQTSESKVVENLYDEVARASSDDDEKSVAESADYSHLPPEQRRKKLQKIIDELRKEKVKEEDGRKAIMKMHDVYRANPALGDANSLEGQIKMSTTKIDKLQAELSQHEAWYTDASGSVQASPARNTMTNRALPEKPADAIPVATQPLASEPESTKRGMEREQSFGDDFDEEAEPIGTCIALYDFDATSEGALSMKAGEKFSVIEADNGDGWTRAMQNDVDGYVPTSYIEVSFFT